jgi:hypothetical protein
MMGGLMGTAFDYLGLAGGFDANFVILGMVGFFTAVVRAPITGAILVTEMSGNFAHFPALVLVSVIASLVAGFLRSEPIYDSLLEQLAPDGRAKSEEGVVVLHVPVFEGSVIDCCSNAQSAMPDGCILVGVLRGDTECLPRPDMAVHPGDILEVLVPSTEAHEEKERLLKLARARPGSHESEC